VSAAQSLGENGVVCRDDEGIEAELRRSLQRFDVALGGVFDGQAAKQELMDLGIVVRLNNARTSKSRIVAPTGYDQ